VTAIWRHQQEAVEHIEHRRNSGARYAILNHGMGSGKTRTTLEFLKRRMAENPAMKVLYLCPKAVVPAVQKQVGLWLDGLWVVPLTKGTAKQKGDTVRAAAAARTVMVIVNYDSAWRIAELEKTKWDYIVYDEIHRLKAPSGAASRWAARLAKKNPDAFRIGLSGTLVPHSVLDLWAIYRAVEAPDLTTFGETYTLHKAKYAVLARGQNWIVGYRNLDDAHERLAKTTHTVKSADVLDLPPITYVDVPCDLSAAEARLYREIESEFVAVVEGGVVSPKNALEQLLRLQQICGGYVKYDGEPAAVCVSDESAKAAALRDMLEDLPADEPVVVFCRFRSDIEAAAKAAASVGRSFGELSGSANDLLNFQQGETKTLITQIQSGGIGVDMSMASYAVFYSLGYSLSEYEQAVARLHRPGQTKHTHIYHLVATIDGRKTVDGRVYDALQERKEVIDVIVDGYARGDRHDRQGSGGAQRQDRRAQVSPRTA
jgi:superfamily II DNA or RNA helicase